MSYNKEDIGKLKEDIIERISNGKSLKNILDSDNDMPDRTTVYRWLNNESNSYDKEFYNNYTRATNERAEYMFDEILTIADNQEFDIYKDDDGREITNHNVINRSKLRVDTRKWALGKMQPKKYGDKIDVTSGDKPIKQSNILLNIDGKSIKLK